jgi:hypothetical protein
MATFTVKFPDETVKKLASLGNKTDEIVEKMLVCGGEVVLPKVKNNLADVIGSDTKEPSKSTGELLSALGVSRPGLNKKGVMDVKIGFREPRNDGDSNAKIANIIEHGRPGQPPRPFLKPAKSATKKACIAAMQATLEEEL